GHGSDQAERGTAAKGRPLRHSVLPLHLVRFRDSSACEWLRTDGARLGSGYREARHAKSRGRLATHARAVATGPLRALAAITSTGRPLRAWRDRARSSALPRERNRSSAARGTDGLRPLLARRLRVA